MKDPESRLRALRIRVADPVQPSHLASLDPGLRAEVNHEVFLFSDRSTLEKFRKNPLRWCGILTDPVSRQRFRPTARSPHLTYNGRPYYFTNDLNLRTFRAIPDRFAVRKGM